MCGICGVVERTGTVDPRVLGRMNDALRHRGPDDAGTYISPASESASCSVGLGFRRLSIIDIAGGNQPIWNEDGSIAIVFNGEIYNFRELRSQLESKGHRFSTATDTEVIVHLYEDEGVECVQRLNGMFAFALWDARRESLFLARDRLGEKPLYYAHTGDRFLFGSELKALLEHPACPRDLDRNALQQYLALEYIPSPQAILSGVAKLPAGHRLVWRDALITVERYWDVTFEPAPTRPASDWVDEFLVRLREAVRLRLISDVPLGALLSGGIDSSAVVALMAEHLGGSGVKTFSIGFAERSFDESDHSRRVAQAFDTDHHERTFTPQVMLDALPRVMAGLDEPFGDASVLPTFMLSEFTRESVTVALGGDGSDELLGGYPTFQAHRAARWYRMPHAAHERVVLPLARRLPVSTKNFSLDFKIKRFLEGMSYPPDVRHAAWLGSFAPPAIARLVEGAGNGSDPYDGVRALFRDARAPDDVARLVYLYTKGYLQDDILVKTDRASMLASLEVRAPFLDHTFVEFLGRVPSELKLSGRSGKEILKRAVEDLLPEGIARRPKKGFGVPLAAWFKDELREPLLDELSPDRIRRQGIFAAGEVSQLVDAHLQGRADNRKQLWTLFAFQLWHRNYAAVR